VVDPAHTASVPPIAAGEALTVTIAVTLQPVETVYVTVVVPAATPVTMPEESPTVAILEEAVDQVPPDEALDNVVAPPSHTVIVPLIGGIAVTVTFRMVLQPVPSV
jgi:hypothetical protein